MDQAASLLLHAPFDRSTATMLCLVLEDGWAEIAIGCKRRRVPDKAGRMNLADGILALAKAGQRNPAVLKFYAVSRARALLGPAATT
jgi:hypothetical protein